MVSRARVEKFLLLSPWSYEYDGDTTFSGIDICWLVVLGILLVVSGTNEADGATPTALLTMPPLMKQLRDYLWTMRRLWAYPGVGPAARYAVAPSRLQYLFFVCAKEEAVVNLLTLVQHLVRDTSHVSCIGKH